MITLGLNIKYNGLYMREGWVGVNLDPDEEEIKDVVLNDEKKSHWRMVFKDNNGRVEGRRTFITQRGGMSTIQRRRR